MQRRSLVWPWLSLGVVYVVWGSTYLAIRLVVREMPPFAAASLRFATAGAAMLALSAMTERGRVWPTRRQWRDYAIAGALLLGGGNAGVMWSEQRVPSGVTALLVATVPLWITLIDGLLPTGPPWTSQGWFGVLIGLAGVAIVARPDGRAGAWVGMAALQASALLWALGTLYAKSIVPKLPTFPAAGIEMLAGAVLLFVWSQIAREDLSRLVHASARAWLALGFLMLFGAIVAFTAFAYSLSALPAATVGTYAYVNPVVAVLLGYALLGEAMSPLMVLGAALILVAVFVATRAVRPVEP